MKIALINENSQAAKNSLIFDTLKKVVEPMGHEVYNYGIPNRTISINVKNVFQRWALPLHNAHWKKYPTTLRICP